VGRTEIQEVEWREHTARIRASLPGNAQGNLPADDLPPRPDRWPPRAPSQWIRVRGHRAIFIQPR
jgi:hypothetical protein